jgi:hypothetical protein
MTLLGQYCKAIKVFLYSHSIMIQVAVVFFFSDAECIPSCLGLVVGRNYPAFVEKRLQLFRLRLTRLHIKRPVNLHRHYSALLFDSPAVLPLTVFILTILSVELSCYDADQFNISFVLVKVSTVQAPTSTLRWLTLVILVLVIGHRRRIRLQQLPL